MAKRTGWGPGRAFQSIGPLKDKVAIRRLASALRIHGGQRGRDMADFAQSHPDAVLARPDMQREMLNHLAPDLRFQVVGRSNPRRRKLSKRAARFIGRTVRRLAHRGERAPQRVAIAYAKARRRGFKVPQRRNPRAGAKSESQAWREVKLTAQGIRRATTSQAIYNNADFLVDLADRMLSQVTRGIHENPGIAIVGANPARGGSLLGYVTGQLRYRRTVGKHPGWYQHRFRTRARLLAMPDGSLRIAN